MGKMKKFCQYIFYLFLLVLGIGQLPSMIGVIFLVMSLLVMPNERVQRLVDEMMAVWGTRWMFAFYLLLMIRIQPMSEVSLAGKSLGKFLNGIWQWLQLVFQI